MDLLNGTICHEFTNQAKQPQDRKKCHEFMREQTIWHIML